VTNSAVPLSSLVGAEMVLSHGKTYALAPDARGAVEVFAVSGDVATAFGGGIDREAALRIVEDDASGKAQERAGRFAKWLDTTVESVRDGVSKPMLAAGYEAWHMGGGCMSWGRNLAGGTHLLVCTQDNRIDGDPEAPEWIVGRYGDEDGFVCLQEPRSLSQALTESERLPRPVDAEGNPVELSVDELPEAVAILSGETGPTSGPSR
jgi:hypothetical protein